MTSTAERGTTASDIVIPVTLRVRRIVDTIPSIEVTIAVTAATIEAPTTGIADTATGLLVMTGIAATVTTTAGMAATEVRTTRVIGTIDRGANRPSVGLRQHNVWRQRGAQAIATPELRPGAPPQPRVLRSVIGRGKR